VSNNYYKARTGKIVTQWPYGALFYGFLTNVSGRVALKAGRAPRPAPPSGQVATSAGTGMSEQDLGVEIGAGRRAG
jgi:hypothetical protein